MVAEFVFEDDERSLAETLKELCLEEATLLREQLMFLCLQQAKQGEARRLGRIVLKKDPALSAAKRIFGLRQTDGLPVSSRIMSPPLSQETGEESDGFATHAWAYQLGQISRQLITIDGRRTRSAYLATDLNKISAYRVAIDDEGKVRKEDWRYSVDLDHGLIYSSNFYNGNPVMLGIIREKILNSDTYAGIRINLQDAQKELRRLR